MMPSPKAGQRILCPCGCDETPKWTKVAEIKEVGWHDEPIITMTPESVDCTCTWMLAEDWDPEVVLEIRIGEALLWYAPGRKPAKVKGSVNQMSMF